MATLIPLPPRIAYTDGGNRDAARTLIIDPASRTDLSGEAVGCDIAWELVNKRLQFCKDYLPAAAVIYQWMPL